MTVKRGDIYYADLGTNGGSIQNGLRPVLIVQNDLGNKYSPTVILAPISSRLNKTDLPTHVFIKGVDCGLPKDSIALCEQIRVINKSSLMKKVGELNRYYMNQIDDAMLVSLGLVRTHKMVS